MKKLLSLVVPCIAASLIALSGCGLDPTPPYSSGVKYGVRQDPLLVGPGKDLAEERYDPDRPGVLPLMRLAQIFEPGHPYQSKLREKLGNALDGLIDASGTKANALTPAERLKLRDKFLAEKKNQPSFESAIDELLRDPTKITEADRAELEAALEGQFGTPAKPTVLVAKIDDFRTDAEVEALGEEPEGGVEKFEEYKKAVVTLKLDDKTLEHGSKLYRIHCLHCHGVPGDGRGPTARWINPHPRDFRGGMFKFQSINQSDGKQRLPSRNDLMRTLRHGLEGTAMPSFNLLPESELDSMVSYVIHLSTRGNAEFDVIKSEFELDKKAGTLGWRDAGKTKARALGYAQRKIVFKWRDSNDPKFEIRPSTYPYKDGDIDELKASLLRGQQLFMGDEKHPRGKAANCKQCHEDYGRQAKFKVDEWGTFARPNNFTQGVFRGGRRPVDVYYRIHSGITGSNMNNFGGVLQGPDIWDLVNFVTNLSYPAMRKQAGLNID